MIISSKRPKNVAIFSFIASILFFVIALLLSKWSGFNAISSAGWFILYVALIWFILCIQFYQRALAEQEKLDLGQLAGGEEQSSTIFQARTEHENLFAVAQGRLKIFEKWFIPVFGAIIALYQIIVGLFVLKAAFSSTDESPKDPLFCSVIMAAIAFVSFLLSRYATGMSAQAEWKPLRAGGSSMLGASLIYFALAIVLALIYLFPSLLFILDIIAKIIPCLMIVLGLEIALNLVMDIYRPRLHGQYSRSSFDSRFLGIINEPGGILRSAADALDYQFGFKVSQTWFYKLLEQAIVPLILFGIVTLYLLSCIVVIAPNEQAIIEHFGNPVNDSNDVRLVGSGLTFKWPWPIEKVYKYPVTKVAEIGIGYLESEAEKKALSPKLWGEKHYEQEYLVLVASQTQERDPNDTTKIPPVNLVNISVPVQYKIKNLYSFIYNHDNPEAMLESICYREFTKYAASARLETDDPDSSKQSLLGKGRIEASEVLKQRVQEAADGEKLGVEIVFLGLQGVHPPVEVAKDYREVTGAIQEKQRLILDKQAETIKDLSTSAGSVEKAEQLKDLINEIADLERSENPEYFEKIEDLKVQLDETFNQAGGTIYQIHSKATTYAFKEEIEAEAKGVRFKGQLKAYRAAPGIYVFVQKVLALEEALQNTRKYVIMADEESRQITVLDLQDKLNASGLLTTQEIQKEINEQ